MTATINASTSAGVVTTADTSGILQLQTNGTAALTVDASQNVGIGTASPTASSSNKTLTLNSPATFNSLIDFKTNETLNFRIFSGVSNSVLSVKTATPLLFDTNSTERMRIDSSGNLLVNQTSLVSGEKVGISFDRTSQQGLSIKNTSSTSPSSAAYINFLYVSTNTGSIASTGTTTTYNTTSDYRLKEDIAPMTGALEKVALLKPVTYKWKSTGVADEGFIAHELAEVCPSAVTGEKDAMRTEQYEVTPAVKDEEGKTVTEAVMGTRTVPSYQGIDTSFLVATLTAAIQELKAIVDAQGAEIAALKGATA